MGFENEFQEICDVISAGYKKFRIPSISLAVIMPDGSSKTKSFGFRNLTKMIEADEDTLFQLGSVSKSFTATCIAILVDQGKFTLDTPIVQYIPEFRLRDLYATRNLTVRDILCHRTGIPLHGFASFGWGKNLSSIDLLEKVAKLEPNCEIRTKWQYSNIMYAVAGYIIERISGLSFEDFVSEYIFKKLSMQRSTCDTAKATNDANIALPYSLKNGTLEPLPFAHLGLFIPAGGIFSCANDMAKWIKMYIDMGKSVFGEQIISEQMIKELRAMQCIKEENDNYYHTKFESYSLGWRKNVYKSLIQLCHAGSIDGFMTYQTYLPDENIGAVALTNLDSCEFMIGACFLIYDSLLNLEKTDWWPIVRKSSEGLVAYNRGREKFLASKDVKKGTSHELIEFCGTYRNDAYGTLTIRKKNRKLISNYNGYPFRLEHNNYDNFEFTDGVIIIPSSFETDIYGKVSKFKADLEPALKKFIEFDKIK